MTTHELSHRMTERELTHWRTYAAIRGFPSRRLQMQLAFTALLMVKMFGSGDGLSIEDFLIDFDKPKKSKEKKKVATMDAKLGAEIVSAVAGVKVRYLGKRRKAKD